MARTKRTDPITAAIRAALPEVEEAIRELVAGNIPEREIVDIVADLADAAIHWPAVIGAPLGTVLEAADGALLRLAVRGIVRAAAKVAG